MSRFLFATMPATGHVVPMLPLARELSLRGHEVHWYTGAVYRPQVQATGAVHHPIRRAEDFGGQTIEEAFPELLGLTGIAMVRQAFERVFIANGGYGTVQQALAHGVPIVVAGATEDKPEIAARVAWSGAGIRLRAQSPTPDRIRDAVQAVAAESSFRARAREIATEMAHYDAPRAAVDLLEQLAQSGAPVTRSAQTLELAEAGR